MTHQIKYREVVLDVTGTYYSGSPGDRECPPESREFEIEKVELSGVNVNELLDEKINELENLIIEKYYS